jgi:hypothetical protein
MSNSDLFDQSVSAQLQKAILKLIFEGCKTASEHCYGNFNSTRIAKDVSGVYRRGVIEDQWSGIPVRFPQVAMRPNWYRHYTGSYCELTCGDVKLTQSCVIYRGDIPRVAEYRSTLATNGQMDLCFEADGGDEGDTVPKYLYAILTYGIDTSAKKREQPAFVKIEFPNCTCTEPVDEGINLIKRYPEIAMQYLSKPSFDAAVTERPARRRKIA